MSSIKEIADLIHICACRLRIFKLGGGGWWGDSQQGYLISYAADKILRHQFRNGFTVAQCKSTMSTNYITDTRRQWHSR